MQRDVPIDIQVVGNVEAYQTVLVKAQVSGEQDFTSCGRPWSMIEQSDAGRMAGTRARPLNNVAPDTAAPITVVLNWTAQSSLARK